MEVERLEVAQLEQVLLDSLQVVVGKIKPEKVLEGVAHHNLGEHGGQSPELAQLVVLQEKSRGRLLNHDLLLSFRLGLFDLTATHGTLLVSQRDVVVDKDLLQLGRLRRADNFLLLHGGLYILLCVFFVRGYTTVLILLSFILVIGLDDLSAATAANMLFLQLADGLDLHKGEVKRSVRAMIDLHARLVLLDLLAPTLGS